MFCPKCGKELENGTNFCDSCGANLAPQPAQEKTVKTKEEKKKDWQIAKKRYQEEKKKRLAALPSKKKTARVLIKVALAVLILAIAACGIYFAISGTDGEKEEKETETATKEEKKKPETEEEKKPDRETEEEKGSIGVDNPPDWDMPEKFEPERIDADEYFEENSQILQEIPAENGGRTEAEAYQNLTERGFTMAPITANYSMKGKYSDPKEISESGSGKHPMYVTYYVTEEGNAWVIYEINGKVFANPVFYNAQSGEDVQVMLSETGTITSYDGTLNKFYETIPNESALKVMVVEKIDAETLDQLTAEEIEDYEPIVEQN